MVEQEGPKQPEQEPKSILTFEDPWDFIDPNLNFKGTEVREFTREDDVNKKKYILELTRTGDSLSLYFKPLEGEDLPLHVKDIIHSEQDHNPINVTVADVNGRGKHEDLIDYLISFFNKLSPAQEDDKVRPVGGGADAEKNDNQNPENPDSSEKSPREKLLARLGQEVDDIAGKFDRNEVTADQWGDLLSSMNHFVRMGSHGGEQGSHNNQARIFYYTDVKPQERKETQPDGSQKVIDQVQEELASFEKAFQEEGMTGISRHNGVVEQRWTDRKTRERVYNLYLNPNIADALGEPNSFAVPDEQGPAITEFIGKINGTYDHFDQFRREHASEFERQPVLNRLTALEERINSDHLEERIKDESANLQYLQRDLRILREEFDRILNWAQDLLVYPYFDFIVDTQERTPDEAPNDFNAASEELYGILKDKRVPYQYPEVTVERGRNRIFLRLDVAKLLGLTLQEDISDQDQPVIENFFTRVKQIENRLYSLGNQLGERRRLLNARRGLVDALAQQGNRLTQETQAKTTPLAPDVTIPEGPPDKITGELEDEGDEEVGSAPSEPVATTTPEGKTPEEYIRALEEENARLRRQSELRTKVLPQIQHDRLMEFARSQPEFVRKDEQIAELTRQLQEERTKSDDQRVKDLQAEVERMQQEREAVRKEEAGKRERLADLMAENQRLKADHEHAALDRERLQRELDAARARVQELEAGGAKTTDSQLRDEFEAKEKELIETALNKVFGFIDSSQTLSLSAQEIYNQEVKRLEGQGVQALEASQRATVIMEDLVRVIISKSKVKK